LVQCLLFVLKWSLTDCRIWWTVAAVTTQIHAWGQDCHEIFDCSLYRLHNSLSAYDREISYFSKLWSPLDHHVAAFKGLVVPKHVDGFSLISLIRVNRVCEWKKTTCLEDFRTVLPVSKWLWLYVLQPDSWKHCSPDDGKQGLNVVNMMILSEEDPYVKDQVEDQSHFGSHPLLTSHVGNLKISGISLMCTLYSTMRTLCS
jgi:hypothetical protein